MHSEVITVAIDKNPLDNPAKRGSHLAPNRQTERYRSDFAPIPRLLHRPLLELVVGVRPQDVPGALAPAPAALHGAPQLDEPLDPGAEIVGDVACLLAIGAHGGSG